MPATSIRFSQRGARKRYTRLLSRTGTQAAFTAVGLTEGALATWPDSSLGDNPLTEATNRPTVVEQSVGLFPGVDFTAASSEKMDLASTITITGPLSIIVFADTDFAGGDRSILGDSATNRLRISSGGDIRFGASSADAVVATAALSDSTLHLIELYRNASDEITVYVDGIDSTDAGPPTDAGDFVVSGVGYDGGTEFYDGLLYHVQVIGRELASIERAEFRRCVAEVFGSTYPVLVA